LFHVTDVLFTFCHSRELTSAVCKAARVLRYVESNSEFMLTHSTYSEIHIFQFSACALYTPGEFAVRPLGSLQPSEVASVASR